jgi:nucleotide-binding universal stress UspA family protein
MFERIAWATDGSEGADLALRLAKALAAQNQSKLIAIHCAEFLPAGVRSGLYPVIGEEEAKAKIEGQVAELGQGGIDTGLKTVTATAGGAAHAIAQVAADSEADLIVVGTRGHTALGGLLLGSVTQRLLHIAHCPVLAVPPADRHTSA